MGDLMLKDEIEKVLRELVAEVLKYERAPFLYERPKQISQALTKILELVEKEKG